MSDICYFGFDAGPLRLTIDGPRGRVRDEPFCYSCGEGPNASQWQSFPGDAVGDYTVTATQGTKSAQGRYRLDPNTTPMVVVAESLGRGVRDVPPGSAVRIGLAGFPPESEVHVAVYYSASGGSGDYVTSFSARVDSAGEGVHTLQTQPGDRPGCYPLATRPEVPRESWWAFESMNGFCLR